jgi:uncharacterized protein (TIGR02391 family)
VSAIEHLPRATEVASFPIDELGLRLLRYLLDTYGSGFGSLNPYNLLLAGGELKAWSQDAPGQGLPARADISEAWAWLVSQGLVARQPDKHDEWYFITRRGVELAKDPRGRIRLQAEQRIDVDLHPRLGDRIRRQFLLGEFELAAFAAMKEVEVAVRDAAGAPNSLIGVNLMKRTFGSDGELRNDLLDQGERDATMALYWGAIGVFKNPSSHRPVEFDDPTLASEVVLLADLLLRLLDRSIEELRSPK